MLKAGTTSTNMQAEATHFDSPVRANPHATDLPNICLKGRSGVSDDQAKDRQSKFTFGSHQPQTLTQSGQRRHTRSVLDGYSDVRLSAATSREPVVGQKHCNTTFSATQLKLQAPPDARANIVHTTAKFKATLAIVAVHIEIAFKPFIMTQRGHLTFLCFIWIHE